MMQDHMQVWLGDLVHETKVEHGNKFNVLSADPLVHCVVFADSEITFPCYSNYRG